MKNVISLAKYRDGLRVEGLTINWRGYRHTFAPGKALSFCDGLQCAVEAPGQEATCGFVIDSGIVDGAMRIEINGWDIGPVILSGDDALDVCAALGGAARAVLAVGVAR